MHHIFTLSTLFYIAFCTFIVILSLHAGNFKGASRTYFLLLNILPAAGLITGIVFLIFLWIHTAWYVSIIVMLFGLVFPFFLSRPLITFFGGGIMSPASMLLTPICAVLMFVFLPTSASEESTFLGQHYPDENNKYEYRSGSIGNSNCNYDVVGEDERENELYELSDFAKGAKDAAYEKGAAPITLINGEKLIDMLIDAELVVKKHQFEYYMVDEDYFKNQKEEELE